MTTQPAMSYAEKKRRGEAIYHAQIRPLIGAGDADKFVKIDVLTGDYEIGANAATAGRILRTRRPGAVIHTMHNHATYTRRIRSPRRVAAVPKAERE